MNNNPNYYAVLTAEVRYDARLSPQEKLLYAEITALANKEGVCFAGNKYFADLYSLTQITISRQIADLEKHGFIKIDYERKGTKITRRNITINKNVNGLLVSINKNDNGSINKNVKDNNTSILTLQEFNISEDAKKCVEYFVECLQNNNPKINRSEKQKIEYAKIFDTLLVSYSVDEVLRMIKYSTTDKFWQSICLSAKKISQHAEQLYIQMKSSRNNFGLDCDRITNANVDF